MDKLRAIKFFCRTVETKSFTSAASALDVPQSVLSKTISALEENLQFTLFNRTTRRVSLTEAGAGFFDFRRQTMVDKQQTQAPGPNRPVPPTRNLQTPIHPLFQ